VTENVVAFNPLDKRNLGTMVAEALLRSPVHPLGDIPDFRGAGIYVIYYKGEFPEYARIAEINREEPRIPIYVGKAIPPGGRKGQPTGTSTTALSARLREHAESVRAARDTLSIEDFDCRYLVLDDIWIPLGERLLIAHFTPLWNVTVDGFGNHDPGKGRHKQMRSRWDYLHPGRSWSANLQDRRETLEDIKREVQQFLAQAPRENLTIPLVEAEKESSPGPTTQRKSATRKAPKKQK